MYKLTKYKSYTVQKYVVYITGCIYLLKNGIYGWFYQQIQWHSCIYAHHTTYLRKIPQ